MNRIDNTRGFCGEICAARRVHAANRGQLLAPLFGFRAHRGDGLRGCSHRLECGEIFRNDVAPDASDYDNERNDGTDHD